MNVLVVGGAGYIGSHVVLDLLNRNHKVTVFDNLSTGTRVNLFEEAHFVQGDVLIPGDLDRLMGAASFDAVVHLAALKAAGDSMVEPERYGNHNIGGSIQLIHAVLRHKIPYFIFSSTAGVYGQPTYIPLDEQHPVVPANFYGFTKLEIERYLHWMSQLKGLSFASLRYFNAAGYDADGKVKGLERNPKNLIPIVMEVAKGQREKIQIFGSDYDTPDGTCIRDYVHVSDLARGHCLALEYLAEKGKNLMVNLGSETGHSVMEVVRCAREVTGKDITAEIVNRRDGDPDLLVASSEKARDLLGWVPTHSGLESLIETTWAVY